MRVATSLLRLGVVVNHVDCSPQLVIGDEGLEVPVVAVSWRIL